MPDDAKTLLGLLGRLEGETRTNLRLSRDAMLSTACRAIHLKMYITGAQEVISLRYLLEQNGYDVD